MKIILKISKTLLLLLLYVFILALIINTKGIDPPGSLPAVSFFIIIFFIIRVWMKKHNSDTTN